MNCLLQKDLSKALHRWMRAATGPRRTRKGNLRAAVRTLCQPHVLKALMAPVARFKDEQRTTDKALWWQFEDLKDAGGAFH